MITTTSPRPTLDRRPSDGRSSPGRRFVGVVARPDTYKSIGYLLLGLPFGTLWFSLLVTAVAVGLSMLVVALLGIPLLLATWYLVRACANVERCVAHHLLGAAVAPVPLAAGVPGNPWRRLTSLSRQRDRWRELAFLLARFPIGIATFTLTTVVLSVPFIVADAPLAARTQQQPFGDWAGSTTIDDLAGGPWGWTLVPVGVVLLFGGLHLLNALARVSGRSATRWLGSDRRAVDQVAVSDAT